MSRRTFGSVRQLPSGRWQARYYDGNGFTVPAPGTFATKAEAGAYLASIETDMRRGVWVDPNAASPTIAEYARTWLAERTVKCRPLAPRTVDTYRHSLQAWIEPLLGDVQLRDLRPADVRAWHQHVLASTGPTAARQAYSLLRAIFNTAFSDELVPSNPCRIRGAGQPTSPERPLIDVGQATRLAEAMPEHLRAMTLVAFWGHARLGELLALRVGDVDLEAGTLRIERQEIEVDGEGPRVTAPKAGSVRTVHLPAPAIDALRGHLADREGAADEDPLFTRADGSHLRAHHVHAAWKAARITTGLPGLHFHDLRHGGLTLSAQSGATIAEVMRRAGHASTAAAMRYQHAAAERDADIAARMSIHAPGR